MLPEVGATELLLVAVVALIVVGPKDLPVLMRKIGQWIAKMRGLAAEFRSSFDEMARQSELDELRKEVEALRNTRIPDPLTNLHPTFEEVSAGLDPTGFSIVGDHSMLPSDTVPEPDPHPQPTFAPQAEPEPEPVPAAKPRAPRKAKTQAAESDADAPAKPKRRAPAKPKAVPTAETDG